MATTNIAEEPSCRWARFAAGCSRTTPVIADRHVEGWWVHGRVDHCQPRPTGGVDVRRCCGHQRRSGAVRAERCRQRWATVDLDVDVQPRRPVAVFSVAAASVGRNRAGGGRWVGRRGPAPYSVVDDTGRRCAGRRRVVVRRACSSN